MCRKSNGCSKLSISYNCFSRNLGAAKLTQTYGPSSAGLWHWPERGRLRVFHETLRQAVWWSLILEKFPFLPFPLQLEVSQCLRSGEFTSFPRPCFKNNCKYLLLYLWSCSLLIEMSDHGWRLARVLLSFIFIPCSCCMLGAVIWEWPNKEWWEFGEIAGNSNFSYI